LKRALSLVEDAVVGLLLLVIAVLPLGALVAREVFGSATAVAIPLAQHANLLLAFAGAVLAAREKKLLRLATVEFLDKLPALRVLASAAELVTGFTLGVVARSTLLLIALEREFPTEVAGLFPLWPLLWVLPIAFVAIGVRLATTSTSSKPVRALTLGALVGGLILGCEPFVGAPAWPSVALLLFAAAAGAPLFVPLAGIPTFLFLAGPDKEVTLAASVPAEMLQLATSQFLPAIPLFTLLGLLLTEGAARRLLAVFRTFFGWVPGGTAVVCALLCAFFSIFTGGSGVTILALGGLLYAAMKQDGYGERESLGLLTGSGALGILLPPALPLILFGIAAEVPIEELFRGGILPGVLMVTMVAAYGMFAGVRAGVARASFEPAAVGRALWDAKFELALPLVTLGLLFSGKATLLESAAGTVVYALLVQVLFHRELAWKDMPRILRESGTLLGGVLIILCAAKGLSSWFVIENVPGDLLAWVQGSVESRQGFLLALNLFLLVVGCFLDIYSATFVVVPLLLPLGAHYGIDPVHLGILFIANLELGYLTPPIGLNLFLASYRFEKPLATVTRAVLPMLLILGIGVLLVTYVPWLTLVWGRADG
jgi:tripartite ATP-independent transporter DctM subunit